MARPVVFEVEPVRDAETEINAGIPVVAAGTARRVLLGTSHGTEVRTVIGFRFAPQILPPSARRLIVMVFQRIGPHFLLPLRNRIKGRK
jgi:hypothetical protein